MVGLFSCDPSWPLELASGPGALADTSAIDGIPGLSCCAGRSGAVIGTSASWSPFGSRSAAAEADSCSLLRAPSCTSAASSGSCRGSVAWLSDRPIAGGPSAAGELSSDGCAGSGTPAASATDGIGLTGGAGSLGSGADRPSWSVASFTNCGFWSWVLSGKKNCTNAVKTTAITDPDSSEPIRQNRKRMTISHAPESLLPTTYDCMTSDQVGQYVSGSPECARGRLLLPLVAEMKAAYALTSGQACSASGRQASPADVVAISLYRSHSCWLSDGFFTSNR
jgi:hypothetical protein